MQTTVSPENRLKKAEDSFRSFIFDIQKKGPTGLLSATETTSVYSFESWLRQKQHPADDIAVFCEHVKSTDYIKHVFRDTSRNNVRIVFKTMLWGLLGGVFLYPVAGGLLWLFNVSVWNLSALIGFAAGGALFVLLFWGWLYVKARAGYKKQKAGQPASANEVTLYIKIFDSDTFSFFPKGSKLFKA